MKRTGTCTVRLSGRDITSEWAIRSGSACCTASRIFSLCRSQSRVPRENKSYQRLPCSPARVSDRLMQAYLSDPLLLRQQRGHIVERFAGAMRVVAVLCDHALLHGGDLLLRLIIRTRHRRHQTQHIAPLLEQIFLHRLFQAAMAIEGEILTALEGHHRLAH